MPLRGTPLTTPVPAVHSHMPPAARCACAEYSVQAAFAFPGSLGTIPRDP